MRSFFAIAPFVGGLVSFTVSAASTKAAANPSTFVPGGYIVELEDSHDPDSFYSTLDSGGVQVSARMNLTYSLFKGASFQLHDTATEDDTVQQISDMTAVKQIWPLRTFTLPKDEIISVGGSATADGAAGSSSLRRRAGSNSTSSADTFSPHVMTQVDKLRALGYTGKGVKLAIIDTGVDYTHPALGGCFGEGCLVSYGYDLVGDDYTGSNTPVPDDDPLDCAGHGTHVSGIVAAQPNEYNFTGAAPDVTLGMYKVFGCASSVTNDVLISAYNMAYEAGSDVITASIGGDNGWSEEPWAVAVQRIVEAGVPCTVAAGNAGELGVFYASGAADGKLVTAVASFDAWDYPAFLAVGFYNTSEEATEESFGWSEGSPGFGTVSLPLWATSNDTTTETDACDALPADTPDLSGYIVLIRRGTCSFASKAENAAAYGAKYVMFYANTAAIVSADVSATTILGTGMVSEEQGTAWVEALNAGEEIYLDVISPSDAGRVFESGANDVTGGYASTFTSWGPTWDLDFYPDVAGPGGNIFSTYPVSQGGYAILSGTSMATPILAAIYALVGQVRGTFDPTTLGTVLTTTAKSQLWNDGNTTYSSLAPAPQQGPGIAQAYDAAFVTTLLSPASISFNDTDHFVDTFSFAIENTGAEAVTYTLGHVAALTVYTLGDTGDLFPAEFPNPTTASAATLAFSASSIDVAAGATVNVTVTPTPPEGLDASRLPVYSGYITVNGTNGEDLALPYLGVWGSLYNAANLDPDNTYLVSYPDDIYAAVAANTTFTVPYPTPLAAAQDPSAYVSYPSALYRTDLGAAIVRVDVVRVGQNYTGNTTTVLGAEIVGSVYGSPLTYNTRSPWLAPFTGRLADGSAVPEGQYALAVRALKLFGDPEVAGDYTSITTVPFTLLYE